MALIGLKSAVSAESAASKNIFEMQKNIFEIPVSIFQNYFSAKTGKEVGLYTWLTSAKYATRVEEIRSITDKEQRKKLKATLPAITPSGLFSERKEEGLIKHSGFIQFDIDFQDNTHIKNYSDLKKQVCNIQEVAFVGLSVSGQGFWGLIQIAHPGKHKEHFKALVSDFKSIGIKIDEAPANVASLRGYSFDSEAYFNFTPRLYTNLAEEAPKQNYQRPANKHTPAISPTSTLTDSQKVEACLQVIEANRIDISYGYSNWYALGVSLAREFGEAGRDYFHRASQFYPGYNQSDADKQFDSCLSKGKGFSIGTFFQTCLDYGVTYKDALPKKTIQPRQQKPAHAKPVPENILPEGFTFFKKTLEYNGLPLGMLNEEELAEAHTKLKGQELEVMKKLNPAVGLLVDKFNLQVEAVEHHSPQVQNTFVLNIQNQQEEVERQKKLGRYVYCGRNKGKVSSSGKASGATLLKLPKIEQGKKA